MIFHVMYFAVYNCALLCVCASQNFASCACVRSVACACLSPRVRAEDYTQIIVNLVMSGTVAHSVTEVQR